MKAIADEAARRRALTDLGSTLLVEAAAGTGKTALIAGRVTFMLAHGVAPSSIAAITFTEFAASELLARVHFYAKQLLQGAIPEPLRLAFPDGLDDVARELLANAAERLDELTAATIHSFCQRLITSYVVEADIDPGAQIIDADQTDAAFQTIVDGWLKRRLNQCADSADPVAVLSRIEPRRVVDVLRRLARFRLRYRRAQTLRADLSGRPDLELIAKIREFGQWLGRQTPEPQTKSLFEDLEPLATFYAESFSKPFDFERLWHFAHPPSLRAMRKDSRELLRPPSKLKSAWERAAGREAGAQAHAQMVEHFDRVDQAYRTILGKLATAIVAALSDHLLEILNDYATFKRAAAVLDFDDLIEKAQDLLAQDEAVRRAIGERFRYILVDEFQDTDAAQCEIVFGIAATARASAWDEAEIRPGALFMVGDPKQAIYRFRGASVETYMRARDAIKRQSPENLLHLTANFRSRPEILDHVNKCFAAPLSKEGQPGYVPLTRTLSPSNGTTPCIAKLRIDLAPEARAADIRRAEAEAVADLCKRLLGGFEFMGDDGRPKRLRPGDIALLAPASSSLNIYEAVFEAAGLPFASQAGKGLYRRQEAQDLLALIRVLADPTDSAAFGALMRGPLIGVSDQALLDITARLRSEDSPLAQFTIRTDVDKIEDPIARWVLTTLQDLRRKSYSTTPALLLSEAVERMMIVPILAEREGRRWPQAVANIEAIVERARNYDVKGLKAFARDIGAEWANHSEGKEGRIDSDDSVTIVTVHSAKGLEWPVVIPINTVTQFRHRESYVYRSTDNSIHWVIEDVVSPDLEDALRRESHSASRERERLLYVACTRARELLVIPDFGRSDANTWAGTVDLSMADLREIRLPPMADVASVSVESPMNQQTAVVFAAEGQVIKESAVPLQWRRATDTDSDRQPVVELATPEGDVSQTVEPVGAGRVRGLVLHKLIEEILNGEVSDSLEELIIRAAALVQELVNNSEIAGLPDPREMAATVLRTLEIPEIATLRSTLTAELPIYAMVPSSAGTPLALAGRIDALSVRGTEPPIPIDWKSDVVPTETDIKNHATQLEDYLLALRAPRGALVYMTTGKIQWVVSSVR